ncbi:MAG: response regulator [Verrucomicrobia bacterium]|nr:MAG: response regulator [Verrucomicrobiota bacterium]
MLKFCARSTVVGVESAKRFQFVICTARMKCVLIRETMNSVAAKILLVEDDPTMAEMLGEFFRSANTTLTHAHNCSEALSYFREQTADLVLLDLGLPGLNGLQLLTELKSSPRTSDIPVVILSGRSSPPEIVRGLELGARDYVTKPFDGVELRARVNAVLASRQELNYLKTANATITEERDEAVQALKRKAEFLANMSHEIRTPMNGVISMAGLILETPLTCDQRSYVDTIYSSAESLLTIINDILDFSKIESGKLDFESQPVDLRTCIEEALDLLGAKAGEKQIDLVYQIEDGVPLNVLGDVTRLRQIVVNLIGNSVKFTDRGEIVTTVKVAAAPKNPENPATQWQIHFSVRDTGIGIPPERLSKLFSPFVQADASTARHFGGTGLGLSISRRLVELMGGKMWAESTPGNGSTFQFVLPFQAAPQKSVSVLDHTQPQLANLRLLIVDDNPTNCRILALQTAKWGMKARTASSGEQSLAWLRAGEKFDLAILDMQMPGMDGLMLASEIRKLPSGCALPLVLLTSMGVRPDSPEFVNAGFATCLTKPIKPAQLFESLIRVVSGISTAPAAKAAPKLDPKLSARLPLRVLLCDDNLINQKVATRLLGQMGYTPTIAGNGIEALQAIEASRFDLIFMDVMMPGMDGLDATREIRQRQQHPATHKNFKSPMIIVAMTASAMPGDRERCLAAGMDDYLSKPVRPEDVRAVIERWAAKAALDTVTPANDSASHTASLMTQTDKPMNDVPPIDMERLNEFTEGDPANLTELVTLYVQQTKKQLEQLGAAIKAADVTAVRRIAHSCAGASATCGMKRIVPILKELERQSDEGKLVKAEELFLQVNLEFELICSAVTPYLAPSSTSASTA